jgi:hypothetical protein
MGQQCFNNMINLYDIGGLNALKPGGDRNAKVALVDLLNGPSNCNNPLSLQQWIVDLLNWTTQLPAPAGFSGGAGEYSYQNMIRHCLWQCLLQYHCGAETAGLAGYLHEVGESPTDPDHISDVINNQTGRDIGSRACEPLDCYKGCVDKAKNGTLIPNETRFW